MSEYHMDVSGTCLGCGKPSERKLNVRMRRGDTGASFGPNLDGVVFCKECGDNGGEMEIRFTPNRSGVVRFTVIVGQAEVVYVHAMRDGHPGQGELSL